MNTTPTTTTDNNTAGDQATERVHAYYGSVKKLGHWTGARRFEVRARRASAVLDLRSPHIPDGDIEIEIGIDHSMVKLLVPQDAEIDHWDLRYTGRGRVKDWTGENGGGRRIRITGEIKHGEIRVHRGGVATLSALFTKEFVQDARRARREGTTPAVADPSHAG